MYEKKNPNIEQFVMKFKLQKHEIVYMHIPRTNQFRASPWEHNKHLPDGKLSCEKDKLEDWNFVGASTQNKVL